MRSNFTNKSVLVFSINESEFDTGEIPQRYSVPHMILASLLLSAIIFVILFGNLLVVIAICTDRALKTTQNWFLASLSVADFLLGLIIMPFSLANEMMGYWYFGKVWCDLWKAIDVLLCTASILSICLISLDRYWSITRAIAYSRQRTPNRAALMIAAVWFLSAVICVPPLIGWKKPLIVTEFPLCLLSDDIGYVLYSTMGSFYIPCVIMVFVYFKIYLAARQLARKNIKNKKMNKHRWENEAELRTTVTEIHVKDYEMRSERNELKVITEKDRSSTFDKETSSYEEVTNGEIVVNDENVQFNDIVQQSTNNAELFATFMLKSNEARIGGEVSSIKYHTGAGVSGNNSHIGVGVSRNNSDTGVGVSRNNSDTGEGVSGNKTYTGEGVSGNKTYTGEGVSGNKTYTGEGVSGNKTYTGERVSGNKTYTGEKTVSGKNTHIGEWISGNKTYTGAGVSRNNSHTRRISMKHLSEKISRKHHKRTNGNKSWRSDSLREHDRQKRKIAKARERRATIVLGLVMAAFILCWLPFFTLYIITSFCYCVREIVFTVVFWAGYCNSALNPIIYTVFNRDFRHAFHRIICKSSTPLCR